MRRSRAKNATKDAPVKPAPPNHIRLRTLNDLDYRTKAARHARDLVAQLTADMGGVGEVTTARNLLIQRAAVLGAVCTDYEARYLTTGHLPTGTYLRAVGALWRVVCTLGLERRAKEVMTIDEYLASKNRRRPDAVDELPDVEAAE